LRLRRGALRSETISPPSPNHRATSAASAERIKIFPPRATETGAAMASPTDITLQFVLPMGQLLFKKCFFDAIRAGTKRTTLRRWTTARLKPGQRAFTPGVGFLRIESVDIVDIDALKKSDAAADGFSSVRAMRKMLGELYPDAAGNRDGRAWFRITFKVAPADVASAASRRVAAPREKTRRAKPRKPDSAQVSQRRRQLADALRTAPR